MRVKHAACAVLLGAALGPFSTAHSQSATIEAGFFSPEGIQMFFVGDLGLRESGTSPPIFWVRMTNPDVDSHRVQVELTILRRTGTGETERLAYGMSKPFMLGPGTTQITNLDMLSLGDKYKLEEYEVNDKAVELTEQVLRTGRLPAGVYDFDIRLTDIDALQMTDDEVISVNISNPTTLDLRSPGTLVTMGEPPTIYTQYPLFRWESGATRFRLTVAGRSGAPGETAEAAIAGSEIRLDKEIYVQREGSTLPSDLPADAIVQPGTFYQYPTSGVQPLFEDSTYYWRVVALVPTSSDPDNPVEITSDIYAFHVARMSPNQSDMISVQIRTFLQGILSQQDYENWFGSGKPLEGANPTGVVMRNLTPIPWDEVQQLQQAFLSGRFKIISVTVE